MFWREREREREAHTHTHTERERDSFLEIESFGTISSALEKQVGRAFLAYVGESVWRERETHTHTNTHTHTHTHREREREIVFFKTRSDARSQPTRTRVFWKQT